MNAPYSITTVVVNENLKKIVEPKKCKYKFLSFFLCAATAGSIASFITCPMDNIKTKLQTQNTRSACEKVENLLKDVNENIEKDVKIPSTNGNMQFKADCNTSKPSEPLVKYKNIYSTAKYIFQTEGFFRGFFKGLIPRVINNAPACAISWGTYEMVKYSLSGSSK